MRIWTCLLCLGPACLFAMNVDIMGEPVREPRSLTWAKRTWEVKSGRALGPGPNDWSDSKDCVRVDEKGFLHLAISKHGQSWNCSELNTQSSLGYGEYKWYFSGDLASLSPRSVLGLFLYEDDENEIDFELSQWGEANAPNAQFVLQPTSTESIHRFSSGKATSLSCSMIWSKSKVHFRCWVGSDTTKKPLSEWTYSGSKIPKPGKERVHLNFWLVDGKAEPNAVRQEIIINNFEFHPEL